MPSTRPKIARRGYNPARALALEYAALTGAPLIDVLAVARKTTDQDAIPGHSRWANVEEAFAADGPVPQGRIILVDDVVTTGATADACSRVLRREGAVSVHLLVAARAVLRRVAITASSARITQ